MRIKAHPGLCLGHGVCRRFAPRVYQLDDEGYLDLHLLAVPPELEAEAELGASVCPVGAITVRRDPVPTASLRRRAHLTPTTGALMMPMTDTERDGEAVAMGGGHDHGGVDPTPALVIDLGSVSTQGRPGAVWSLPHGGDLDANLVHLAAHGRIDVHRNDEVDVVLSVVAGNGELTVDDVAHPLRSEVFALVPRGARRQIRAGGDGITYLSIHRRRAPLEINASPPARGGR